jgi:hypothetical protein
MKLMRFLTDSDRVIVDIHPERKSLSLLLSALCAHCLSFWAATSRNKKPPVQKYDKFAQEIVTAVVELEAGRMSEDDYCRWLEARTEGMSPKEWYVLAMAVTTLQGHSPDACAHYAAGAAIQARKGILFPPRSQKPRVH